MNRRILVVDDMPSIHEDFRKILQPPAQPAALDALEAELFGTAAPCAAEGFEMDSAYQGREGLDKVVAAKDQGRPFALAFVDMRMPPGWDGVQTIERLWQADPDLQVVICSAYSDHSWDEVRQQLGGKERLLILAKPFDPSEVGKLANALTDKWSQLH